MGANLQAFALKHSSITLYTTKIPLINLRQALGFLFYLEQRTRKALRGMKRITPLLAASY